MPTLPDTAFNPYALRMSAPPTLAKSEVQVKAMPNPAREYVTFEYHLPTGDTEGQIQVFDVRGSTVFWQALKAQNGLVNFDMTTLPSGLYYYIVTTSTDQSLVQKLVVEK